MAALALVSFALTSCGGGGGGGNQPFPAAPAIDRSGQSAGTVDGFGSIFVNGVEWDTDTAQFTIDDQPGSQANLTVGEFVLVSGDLDDGGLTGTAERVEREPLIRGMIASIDLVAETLVVLEQTVLIDGNTVFAAPLVDLAGLMAGDSIEIDGLFAANGEVLATLVKAAAPGASMEVRGVVANNVAATNRFMIGALMIDATTAAFEDFATDIANGDFVEVEGTAFDGTGALLAERVELEELSATAGADEGTQFEIEGLITSFTNATDFAVGGVPVITNQATEFENGTELDLVLNIRVEVEGSVDANGAVVADEVEFKLDSDLVIEALVEAVATTGDSFTMLGVEIGANATTQLIDESDAAVANFTIADLVVGDYVKVKAVGGTTPVVANLIKRKNPENDLKITGLVSSVTDPDFMIDGALVHTDGATSFEDATETPITAADFFLAVQAGSRVEAEGQSPAPGELLAESIELK
ncbi:MAG: DUF5666 domain-containing protein [Gammaproteobacteria bacterium]|nr:DUF5666 domain-containing protein [Gammaproteobacteria bacterium]